MINYATYNFYSNEYKGALSNDLFNSLIPKASRIIDRNVNRELTEDDLDNEAQNFGEKIQFVACELVDYLHSTNGSTGTNVGVSSISIDGVSKTYKTYSNEEQNKQKSHILSGLPHDIVRCL